MNELIVKTEGICGGRPRIKDSRVTVETIFNLYKEGESIEDIHKSYPHISKMKISHAISYGNALEILEKNTFNEIYGMKRIIEQVEYIIKYEQITVNSSSNEEHPQHLNSKSKSVFESYDRFKKMLYEEEYPVCEEKETLSLCKKALDIESKFLKENISYVKDINYIYEEILEALELYDTIVSDVETYYSNLEKR